VLSEDGSTVAFESDANNLGGTTDSSTQIYAGSVVAQGATVLVSRGDGEAGKLPDASSQKPSISDDGNLVAFESQAGNLVADATGPGSDVFVRTIEGGKTKLESRAAGPTGAAANGESSNAPAGEQVRFGGGITANGACVAFLAPGNVLGPVAGALDYLQAYMHAFKADCGGRSAKPFTAADKTAPVLRSAKLTTSASAWPRGARRWSPASGRARPEAQSFASRAVRRASSAWWWSARGRRGDGDARSSARAGWPR
jgi:hypothetical protein